MTSTSLKSPSADNIDFDEEKIQLLKNTICKGSTNDELQLFLHACKRTGLDPFMRQIYAVKRYDSGLRRETMTIQTGIDGYRLIAERTGRYAPGKETIFTYDDQHQLISATAYIKKQTPDGTWHEVSATAFYSEYVATVRLGDQYVPNNMWRTKPHIMLGKCAEALALRRAFPAELSGIYTAEEMQQAENKGLPLPPFSFYDPENLPAGFMIKVKEYAEQMDPDFLQEDLSKTALFFAKYCNHWRKTLDQALQDYEDTHKFAKHYNLFVKKNPD